MISVTSKKFFSQIANGETFGDNLSDTTQNLVGSVIERIIAEHEVTLSVISQSDGANSFTIAGTTITKASGTWADDDWNIGDTFAASNDLTFTGTITGLSGSDLTFTLGTGTATAGSYTDLLLELTSEYSAAVYEFGLKKNH